MMPGFRHVPYNDLAALQASLSPATVAVLIEGIQGESGIISATPEYLLGVRKLCDERRLLMLMDGVQCGYFRTGRFQSYQRILEGLTGISDFTQDGISMAKSMGSGFPIGAFWVREKYADLLSAGTHATTYGGTPLGCAVALKTLEVIERDNMANNAREIGAFLKSELEKVQAVYPKVLKMVRGVGLMIGLELSANIPALSQTEKTPAYSFVQLLHQAGVLTIPAGRQVIRLLPALNLTRGEAEQGLAAIQAVSARLSS